MKALSLSASVLAAAVLVATGPVGAADLDYRYVPPPDRFSSAYEDPRYRDLYAPEPPRAYSYAPRPYEPAPHPVPPGYVYRDRVPDRYSDWDERRDWREAQGCVPRHEIKRRLVEDGWSEFHDLELGGSVARVRARRPNGDLFALKVDRCTGEVVKAHLLERVGAGPYAWRGDDRRFGRPYY